MAAGKIEWSGLTGIVPNLPPVLYITGQINCASKNDPKIVQVKYYSFEPSCNSSEPVKITVNKVNWCTPGCTREGPFYVAVTCDVGVKLPRSHQWAQTISFADDQCVK